MRRILPVCLLILGVSGTVSAESARQNRAFDGWKIGEKPSTSDIKPIRIASSPDTVAVPDRQDATENTTFKTTSAAPAGKPVANEVADGMMAPVSGKPWTWRILRLEWTDADETGFEDFVRGIQDTAHPFTEEQAAMTHSKLAVYRGSGPR